MKNPLAPGRPALTTTKTLARAGLSLGLCLGLTGCFGILKPAQSLERRFVLTALSAEPSTPMPADPLAVGIGPVKLASYLLDTSLAVRRGANEIEYLPQALWAERLDAGLERVVAANLGNLLPTDKVRRSAWRSEDVQAGVFLTVDQLDVTPAGEAVLMARWRIMTSNGLRTLREGQTQRTQTGPSPESDPAGCVTTLSALVGDLSRELAVALKETASAGAASPAQR